MDQPAQSQHSSAGPSAPASASDSTDWLSTPQNAQPASSTVSDHGRNAMERPSGASLRAAFRSNPTGNSTTSDGGVTIRAVTPDMGDLPDSGAAAADAPYLPRGIASHETSPRSIPGGPSRRQGMVFNDSFGDPYESSESSPPPGGQRLTSGTIRPRTRTMDTAMLTGQRAVPPGMEQRHRVGSVSSGDDQRQPAAGLESTGFPTIMSARGSDTSAPSSSKSNKKGSSRRLVKRQSSRPTSPHVKLAPSIDSLPFPMPTENPQKLTLLMKALCGKMKGEIEYQGEAAGPWHTGVAYIDDDRGCLIFDSGQNGPFHIPLVSDLRGCRILPVDYPEADKRCVELVSMNPVIEIVMHPLVPGEFDLWLAALLCWQQLRPTALKLTSNKTASPVSPVRPELKRRGLSTESTRSTNIIKVGKLQVWDKGPAPGPKSSMRRSTTRDSLSPATSWRRVSCILQDNGEFKLMAENDITILAVLDLSQLSRNAIQQLDRTVLDEEYCIAIFPMYASTSQQLSIYRPVYLALDNRIHFEVWFTLLRALAVPDMYKVDNPNKEEVHAVDDVEKDHGGEIFRVEKTIMVRVTEAKIKGKTAADASSGEQTGKADESLVGNYLAEVMLDGEVRARTTTKYGTKNPFWREDCEFIDLPSSTPHLSVVLKRVEGGADTPGPSPVTAAMKSASRLETVCGTVELPLQPTTAGVREHEEWLPILDDKHESIGTMLMKVVHEEHVVLLAKEYQPLGEILHNFNSGLTTLISTALPGQLRRLAELFLNLFQVSGAASEWLMALVEDEIDGIGSQSTLKKYRFNSRLKSNESTESTSDRELIVRDMSKNLAGEANLLFRGNTLLTQSLELHMRRLGKDFLEEILQDKLFEINELDPDCEVDPSKIPKENGELDAHWNRLIELTTSVWHCIAASAKKINPELRSILKYIRAVAEDRYGDFLRPVAYTAVSGFLFLRFICPAILSPKLFGLLRDHPRPRAQRTFTLIAKALQKLANLSTFGKREEWMEPMNRFLNVQRSVFRDYIDQVCDVPAERSGRTLHASYSTPVTILSRLNPTAREGFPSLPFLIDQSRNYASLIKLWVDLKPTDNKKVTLDGDLLVFSDLCTALQQRADACLAKHEAVMAATPTSPTTKPDELADILEQASLIESLNYSYGGSTMWDESADHLAQAISSGDEAPSEVHGRKSKDVRRGRDMLDVKKGSSARLASGTHKAKNGKMGRHILSGIMRIGGRAESPDSKDSSSKK